MSARTQRGDGARQQLFYALAEPTRRNIVEMLATNGRLSATDICNNFTVSPQAISQHLKVLREAELVRVEKKAQQRIYEINPDAMLELSEWVAKLTALWNERFDALDKVLADEKRKSQANHDGDGRHR
ncbi:MAG: metalloregulator ArsR/SmtB family transcription factor [Thaumarchaeota archaeon]|nr:metalloregulator ArsR/SmtB family transcription factor [Nitrososphaerota archaeon]